MQKKNPVLSPSTASEGENLQTRCWCNGEGGSGPYDVQELLASSEDAHLFGWDYEYRGGFLPERKPLDGAFMMFEEYCSCPVGQRAQEEHWQAAHRLKQQLLDRGLERDWNEVGVPKRFEKFRLETSPLVETMPDLVERLRNPGGSWYLWGPFGVGKTGLAVGYARQYLELNRKSSVLYRTVPGLLTELKGTYGTYGTYGRESEVSEESLLRRYSNVTLLVMDELGVDQDSGSGWLQDRLYQIIGNRHAEEKDTVFTSNLSVEQLARKLNGRDRTGAGDRIAWRIVEMAGKDRIVEIQGRNLRVQK